MSGKCLKKEGVLNESVEPTFRLKTRPNLYTSIGKEWLRQERY